MMCDVCGCSCEVFSCSCEVLSYEVWSIFGCSCKVISCEVCSPPSSDRYLKPLRGHDYVFLFNGAPCYQSGQTYLEYHRIYKQIYFSLKSVSTRSLPVWFPFHKSSCSKKVGILC